MSGMSCSDKLLCVPLNDEGIKDCDFGLEINSSNVKIFNFPYSEFDYMHDLFCIINNSCNLLIDEFEEERISKEFFNKVEDIIGPVKSKIPVFYEAFELAVKLDTCLDLIL